MMVLRPPLGAALRRSVRPLSTSARALASPQYFNHEHVPLSRPHKLALTLGSAMASFYNPARGDMIALLGELSGEAMLPRLREMMSSSHEGRSLLMERPVINTKSVDMNYLEQLDETTFGKHYWRWLKWCRVGPDTRAKVRSSLLTLMLNS
jgi:ubiquinone biosynthesis protein COQ4